MKFKDIDWGNHLIAFGASVIGIFIAFQLDDWQDRRSERQKLVTTLQAIREEVEENISIYRTNDSLLSEIVGYGAFMESHWDDNYHIIATIGEMDSMIARHPTRFKDVNEIGTAGQSKKRFDVQFVIDVLPRSGISTSSWEAAKASGMLTNLDHPRMAALTQIYEWTSKRIGVSDEEFMENFIHTKGYDDVGKIMNDYKILAQVMRWKLGKIKEEYSKIDWELE